jgi:hypothetical protein
VETLPETMVELEPTGALGFIVSRETVQRIAEKV